MSLKHLTINLGIGALLLVPGLVNALTIETGVAVSGTNWNHTCDRIHWTDRLGHERIASLVQANGQNSGSYLGGQLCQLQWNNGTTVKTATEYGFPDDLSGLGVTVNHYGEGGDYVTDRQRGTNGSSGFVFVGDHHAVWRFTCTLPTTITSATPNFPATLEYVFKDGDDQFQWIVTFDCSAITDQPNNDSRGPYCEFDWASSGTEATTISGQGYGTFRKVLMNNSASTYTVTAGNVVPYIWEFNQQGGADVELGYVATRPQAKHRCGNFLSYNAPGSGALSALKWEYQMNSMSTPAPGSQRCTFEVGYSALMGGGQIGISPKQENYSLSIMIDKYSSNGVTRLVSDGEAIHNNGTSLTATTGTVVSTGLESPGLSRTITYDKSGFDQTYRNWALAAANGQVAATLVVASGKTVSNPTFAVRNYSSRTKPATVQKNGTTLVEGTGYYCSIDTARQECWVTYLSDFTGSTTIAITGTSGTLAFSSLSVDKPSIDNSTSNLLTFTATVSGATAVSIDLSSLGGGSAVAMSGSGSTWTASYTASAAITPNFKNVTATAAGSGITAQKSCGVQVTNSQDIILYTDGSSVSTGWQSWGAGTGSEQSSGGAEGSKYYLYNYNLNNGWYDGLCAYFGGWIQFFNFTGHDTLSFRYKLTGPASIDNIVLNSFYVDKDTSALVHTFILKNVKGAAANWTQVKMYIGDSIPRYGFGNMAFNLSEAQTGTGQLCIDDIRFLANKRSTVQTALPAKAITRANDLLHEAVVAQRSVILNAKQPCSISIFDLLGNQYAVINSTGKAMTWHAPAAGAYFVKATAGESKEIQRIIVK